jgi:hypothetical protein
MFSSNVEWTYQLNNDYAVENIANLVSILDGLKLIHNAFIIKSSKDERKNDVIKYQNYVFLESKH